MVPGRKAVIHQAPSDSAATSMVPVPHRPSNWHSPRSPVEAELVAGGQEAISQGRL